MINLLEEEYDAASGKYILHLTMGTEDTLSDLPSAERPFNSSNYSCFFDYGEPAENSTAVDEESGEIYLYSNGEWAEPEPAGVTKVPVLYPGIEETPNPMSVSVKHSGVEYTGVIGDYLAIGAGVSNRQAGFILAEVGDTVSASKTGDHSYIRIVFADGTEDTTTDPTEPVVIPDTAIMVVCNYRA